jgi:hypothetical protein
MSILSASSLVSGVSRDEQSRTAQFIYLETRKEIRTMRSEVEARSPVDGDAVRYTATFTTSQIDKAKVLAKERGHSVSQVIRDLVQIGLDADETGHGDWPGVPFLEMATRLAKDAMENRFSERYGWSKLPGGLLGYFDNNPIESDPAVRENARKRAVENAAANGFTQVLATGYWDDEMTPQYTMAIVFGPEGFKP